MKMRIGLIASFVLLSISPSAILCAADRPESDKPPQSACRENNHGSFWPVSANDDPRLLQAKAAEGELWVCHGNYDADFYFPTVVHMFKWQRVSVRYASAARRDSTAPPTSDAHP